MKQLQDLFSRFRPVPADWLNGVSKSPASSEEDIDIQPLPCDSWQQLVDEGWEKAMMWTVALDDTFSIMLSQVASCNLLEDQLWIRPIGRPGTAKSTLCFAIECNKKYAFRISKMTGLHSGFKENGENLSLIEKMKNKTTVINEGDTILKAPNKDEILSDFRDLYSGKISAIYRNGVAYEYPPGLRTGIILAGTPIIRELNRSSAGDRFLDVVIHDKITLNDEKELVRAVIRDKRKAMLVESNCDANSKLSPKLMKAYQLTSGYINWLRENVGTKIREVEANTPESVEHDCEILGKLTAVMRTRPSDRGEEPTEPELHIRLTSQFFKMAMCIAVVLNKKSVDAEVMRRVARSARDTCYGHTFDICKALLRKTPLDDRGINVALRGTASNDAIKKNIRTLVAIGCVRMEASKSTESGLGRKIAYSLTLSTKNMLNKLKELWQDEI